MNQKKNNCESKKKTVNQKKKKTVNQKKKKKQAAANACKASLVSLSVLAIRFMASDSAASLIHELHARLLRHLAAQQQTHFEGLAVAARQLRKQGIGSSRTWETIKGD